jgi:hypothetical protein
MDDAVALEFPQVLRQHFLRDARQVAAELGEALRLLGQVPEDRDLPAPADHAEGDFRRAYRFAAAAFHTWPPVMVSIR